jgi:hypothetical protein
MKNRLVWGTGIWLIKISFLFILLCRLSVASLPAQSLNLKNQIADSLTRIANQSIFVGQVGVDNISIDQKSKKVIVSANEKLGYIPFRNENVRQIYVALNNILRPQYKKYDIVCQVDNKPIEELIPNFFRSRNKIDEDRFFVVKKPKFPLVKNLSRPYMVSNGLSGKNIALWASHGLYFDQKLLRWEWQRARVMQTVEDLYTLSYVYPFLMPMLENAGATVLTPRERDTQCHEIIVDNDIADSSEYHEFNQTEIWSIGKTAGFASSKNFYLQGENPFKMGSYRQISSVSNKKKISFAEWKPNIPETGKYAVYVSYNSLENSTSEAHYTVYHQGGETEFSVNQTMGGGTWIYLGQFYFHKGKNDNGKVVLTNLTGKKGETVTADAVKFGGGMGNIARFFNQKGTIPNQKSSDKTAEIAALLRPDSAFDWKYQPQTSGYPRFSEGARYWLQWAGFPDSIYSPTKGANDYVDDYQSRSKWVNYLIGGSILDAEGTGLKIPVDLSFAFHTDAGVTKNDSVIGTLGICAVNNFSGKDIFKNNVSRWTSRDLTDMVQTQIVNDIRLMCDTQWTRRGIWNKPYYEAKGPEVPAMLLELLSHQNFADMRYGLDPQFQFLVCRSIYKGILKYLSFSENRNYTVQPLPVTDFSVQFIDSISVKLQWKSRKDPFEPTAEADHFVVYSRTEEGAFDNGVLVNTSQYTLKLKPGTIYSFKVTAVNKGGESFPSEILSVYRDPNEKGTVLIVNGFQRVSAPSSFAIDTTYAGFLNTVDAGVPYLYGYNFTGPQFEFRRNKPWLDDDAPGFGASHANYEGKVVAGNSFDYPFLHGKAVKAAGYSFVSCSSNAVEKGDVNMNDYRFVDLILGKQRQIGIDEGEKVAAFKTFPEELQKKINLFCLGGGNLLVTGASIASDLCDKKKVLPEDVHFLEHTLKLKFRTHPAAITGEIKYVPSPFRQFDKHEFSYYSQPNPISYHVESPDAIEPAEENAFTFCRYVENNLSAGVIYSGNYKVCALGFPFETIVSENDRQVFMQSVLNFFADK